MDECLGRSLSPADEVTLPVAYLICNQTPPLGDSPSLMTFEGVEPLVPRVRSRPPAHANSPPWSGPRPPPASTTSNGMRWSYPASSWRTGATIGPHSPGWPVYWQTGAPLAEADLDQVAGRSHLHGRERYIAPGSLCPHRPAPAQQLESRARSRSRCPEAADRRDHYHAVSDRGGPFRVQLHAHLCGGMFSRLLLVTNGPRF